MLLFIWSSLILLLQLQSFVHTHDECAIKEMVARYESGGTELLVDYEVPDADSCYEECCKRAAKGCNAASFFRLHGQVVCKNIACKPNFHSCVWESDESVLLHNAFSAEIKIYSSNVTLPPVNNQNVTVEGNASSVTPNMTQYFQQVQNELENNEDRIFGNNKPEEQWNLDYNGQNVEGTTTQWAGNAFTSTPVAKFEDAVTNTPDNIIGAETTTYAHVEGNAPTGNDEVNKGNLGSVNPKPHISHGNSGIYGPSEVEDYDYSATPLIVIGAVVTVLFLLIVLICVGRKLSASERLKYRPLRDSFPASNSYHDIE